MANVHFCKMNEDTPRKLKSVKIIDSSNDGRFAQSRVTSAWKLLTELLILELNLRVLNFPKTIPSARIFLKRDKLFLLTAVFIYSQIVFHRFSWNIFFSYFILFVDTVFTFHHSKTKSLRIVCTSQCLIYKYSSFDINTNSYCINSDRHLSGRGVWCTERAGYLQV